MHRALLHETHLIEVALGRTEPLNRPQEAERLPMSDYRSGDGLIEGVDGLLAERDTEYRGWTPPIHRNHYRVLSLHDAHECLRSGLDRRAAMLGGSAARFLRSTVLGLSCRHFDP
jgi:hypothetical protein